MAGSSWPGAGTEAGQDANAVYSLGSSDGETARLQRQAGETELDDLDTAVRAHLNDPRTMAIPGHLFLVWGRKPA